MAYTHVITKQQKGRIIMGIENKRKKGAETSNQITEKAESNLDNNEKHIEDAQKADTAIREMALVDSDLEAAAQESKSEAHEIAEHIAQNEIEAPSKEASSLLDNLSNEFQADGSATDADAAKSDEIQGAFDDPGAKLRAKLEAAASEFHQIAAEAAERSSNIDKRSGEMAKRLISSI